MNRLAPIFAFAVSLLIWLTPAFCSSPSEVLEKTITAAAEKTVAAVKAVPTMMQMQPVSTPMPPPPQQTGLAGGLEAFFRPARYQPVPSHVAGFGPPPGYGSPQEMYPPGMYPPGNDMQEAYPSDYQVIVRERIVYVPYSSPPPIYVERLGKALPRLPVTKWMLGDAYMQEYPEMPLRMYTTRGPRDFLAPNPPSIGY